MAAAPRDPPLLYSDREHCIAVSGNMMISLSLQPPNASYLAAWSQVMDQLVSSQPGSICVIIVIDAGARPPDEASKTAIRNTAQRHASRIGALAYVVEGSGFAAAAVRSALSIVSLVARFPFPLKVLSDVAGAGAWISEKMGPHAATGTTPPALLGIVERLRAVLATPAATRRAAASNG